MRVELLQRNDSTECTLMGGVSSRFQSRVLPALAAQSGLSE
jgi:hypothetical protein